MEKNYEIIVYGASGFTGKICCKYLRDKYADLKWGIAGRNGAVSYTHLTLPTMMSV